MEEYHRKPSGKPPNAGNTAVLEEDAKTLFGHIFGEAEGYLVTFTGKQARLAKLDPNARENELTATQQKSWRYPDEAESRRLRNQRGAARAGCVFRRTPLQRAGQSPGFQRGRHGAVSLARRRQRPLPNVRTASDRKRRLLSRSAAPLLAPHTPRQRRVGRRDKSQDRGVGRWRLGQGRAGLGPQGTRHLELQAASAG